MLLKDLYEKIISSEENALAFLRENNLLDAPQGAEPCHRCGSTMQEKKKRDRGGKFRHVLRCGRKGCQTSRSIRKGNAFFYYTDINNKLRCNLSLCEILELVFFFVMEIPMSTTVTLTGKSSSTVTNWFNMCREVCGAIVCHRVRGKMVGTDVNPIHICGARLPARRKFPTRGKKRTAENPSLFVESDALKNSGCKIDGPWLIGLKQGCDCRYFYVQELDRKAVTPIIELECEAGSVIHSDDWPAFGNLNAIGYNHLSVNNEENHMDPATGAIKTEGNERSWLDAKIRVLQKMKYAPNDLFQSHLDHSCWKALRKDVQDLFLAFLNDIRRVYR